MTVTGGATPITFAVTAGTLPDGLTLSTDGLLSGTPTTGGPATFTITATDANSATADQAFTLDVKTAPTIDQTTLPDTTVGATYSQQLTVTGGVAPVTFAVTTGTLPAGLTLTPDGFLSGTPTTSGSTDFTITATDADGGSSDQPFTVVVNAAPVIDQTTLPATTVTAAYSQQLTVTGGTTPVTFAVTTGTLPAGLTLAATGLLSGTPTTAGSSDFTVTATDSVGIAASQAFTVVVNAVPMIDQTTLPDTSVGGAYNQGLTVTGGTAPVTFAVTTGALPAGLTLDPATGLITGSATTAGSTDFTITATDAAGVTADQAYTFVVNAAPVINQTTLPAGEVGAVYMQQLTITGGTGFPTFAVTTGTLPAGLNLDVDGFLSGTPTAAGSSDFTVTATDTAGATAVQAFTLDIQAGPVIDQTTLPATTVGATYSQQLTVTGGTSPYTFSLAVGTLPDGLTLSADGLISGTPTTAGSSDFTIEATDADGVSATQAVTLVVDAAPVIDQTTLPATSVGGVYNQQLTVTGGTTPITFAVTTGTLPAGLHVLDANDGLLSGTATTAGSSDFTVTATDAAGATADQVMFTVVVNAAPVIDQTTLPDGEVGVAYSQQLHRDRRHRAR